MKWYTNRWRCAAEPWLVTTSSMRILLAPSAVEMTNWAEQTLKKRLENVRGVGSVSVVGGTQREINLYLQPRALEAYGLPPDQVVAAVRNVFYDRIRCNRELPSDDMIDEINGVLLDGENDREEDAFATAALAALPQRWQRVLWHTEVEGLSAAEIAPLLGLAPNAVAALAYRAREGLRQAYQRAQR